MPGYTVAIYHPGHTMTEAELTALGPKYTPDDRGLHQGRLRLAASNPQLAAEVATAYVHDRTGLEVVTEVVPTWAGSTW
ncbi:MAG: hypothetical protein ACRDT6_16850 [Micromonosporaceae bacterium]